MEVCFMYSLFTFFIPSIIGVRINNYFNKDLKVKNMIYSYITLLFFSLILNVLIMYNFFGVKEDIFKVINSDTILFAEMAIISVVINVVLEFTSLAIQKNVSFKIEVSQNETKTEAVSNSNNKTIAKGSKNTKRIRKTNSKTAKKDKDK